jgi:hypothetical protein
MSKQALDGEVILAVRRSNVEDIIHHILENPLRNAQLYMGEMFDDNLKVASENFAEVTQEYQEKRKNPMRLLKHDDEQAYHIKMMTMLDDAKDMLLATAQIGQAVLTAMQAHDFGLEDNKALALHNYIKGTVVRCAEPLNNISVRQQEIMARGLIKPTYSKFKKGPKMG